MSGVKLSAGLVVGGWLATTLASTDPDVDAGVAAYDAGTYDEALTRFDAAKERLGDRPEISFDRGLALLRKGEAEASRTAFERATESEDADLRGSAHYELGNLSFEAEAWDPAIASYIECLKANPVHANAKWNLELALQKKKEQEEEEEKNEDENEDGEENEDGDENEDGEENEDKEDGEDEEKPEDEPQDENEDEEKPQDEPEDGEDEEKPEDESEPGEDDSEPDEGEDPEQEDQPSEQDDTPGEDEDTPEPEQAPAEPKPIDKMDLDRALEKLDEQDPFTLEKPSGGYVQPEKDW